MRTRPGELVEIAPTSFDHGGITNELAFHVTLHVRTHDLGRVTAAETGYLLSRNPDTVRVPDIAFVRKDRLPLAAAKRGFFPAAPDLAVEVLSPGDLASEVLDKVGQWLSGGGGAVRIVDPKRETLAVYSSQSPPSILRREDTLTGGDLLPGFALRVGDLPPLIPLSRRP